MARKVLDHLDLSQNELRQALAHILGSDPSSPTAGQFWYHSGTGTLRFRNASSSIIIGRLDQISAPTSDVSWNSRKLTNLASPSVGSDAVNKDYADALRQGIADVLHDPVRVAVSTNVNISSPGASQDGVSLTNGDRVLLYGQSTGSDIGIYNFNGTGTPMTRASDADATGEIIDGSLVAVQEGSRAGWVMIQTATPSGSMGSWAQTWIQYSTGSSYSADGVTLQLIGSTFSLLVPVGVSSGGTGAITAAGARANLGAAGKYVATIGNGGSTSIQVTHNLGTRAVVVSVHDASTYDEVECGVQKTDPNYVTLTFAVAPASNSLSATVIG